MSTKFDILVNTLSDLPPALLVDAFIKAIEATPKEKRLEVMKLLHQKQLQAFEDHQSPSELLLESYKSVQDNPPPSEEK